MLVVVGMAVTDIVFGDAIVDGVGCCGWYAVIDIAGYEEGDIRLILRE